MDNVLEVKNLKTSFLHDEGIVQAVNGVSFTIGKRETVGIVGESGCGKTITGWSIMRLLPETGRIDEGQILLNRKRDGDEDIIDLADLDIGEDELSCIRGGEIGMIFQEPMTSLSPLHSVGNQITEAILLHDSSVTNEEAREKAVQLLGRVGIPRAHEIIDEYPHQLSGGMRQRVMIAIALACDPILLIADEPTTALDVTIQAQILRLLQELQQDYGMSILFISHDLGVIAEMADRVFVMYMGRIVESALVEELFRNPKHPYTVALLKSIPGAQKTVKTKLDSIHGSIPSPFAVLKGCSFFARCTQRMKEICESAPPDEYLVGENHSVACYHYKEGVN